MIVPVRLRSTDRMIVPVRLQSTDRPIDELYVQLLSLPPLVPYYHPNRLLLLPPAAKPTPYCLPTAPQAQKKNCQKMAVKAVKAVNDSASLNRLTLILL